MKNDSVTIAFEIILEEISSVVAEVNLQGGEFFKSDDYEKARSLMDTGKKLHEFHHKLHTLKLEWVNGLDEPTRRQVKVDASSEDKSIASSPKAPKTGLIVKFSDRTVLNFDSKRSINRVPCAARSDVIGVRGLAARPYSVGSAIFQGSSAS